jgi:hypothetical protein
MRTGQVQQSPVREDGRVQTGEHARRYIVREDGRVQTGEDARPYIVEKRGAFRRARTPVATWFEKIGEDAGPYIV